VEGNITFGHFMKEVHQLLKSIAPRHSLLEVCLGETAAPLPSSQVHARLQSLGARHGTMQVLHAGHGFPPYPTGPQVVGGSLGSQAGLCNMACRGAFGTGGVGEWQRSPTSTRCSKVLAMRRMAEGIRHGASQMPSWSNTVRLQNRWAGCRCTSGH